MGVTTLTYSPNTYAGELYKGLITPSIIPAQGLVSMGLVTPLPGIKKRTVLRTMDFAVEFQNPSCDFVGQTNTSTVAEKYIDPVKYEVMVEICYADVRTSWDAAQLKKGSLNDYVPPNDFEALILEVMQVKIGLMNEQLYVNGKTGVTTGTVSFSAAYLGLIGRLKADATVLKYTTGSVGNASNSTMTGTAITLANPGVATVTSTANLRTGDKVTITANTGASLVGGVTIVGQTFTITVLTATTFSLNAQVTGAASTGFTMMYFNASNILDVLTYVYNNVPLAVSSQPDFKIWISRNLANYYQTTQATVAALGMAGANFVGEKPLDFLGSKLIVVDALPANTIIGARAGNIFLGFDDSGDEDYIRVTDMAKSTGDDKWRYKASMKTDINYIYGNEILFIAPVIS
jgi:hypothetical protein